MRKSVEYRVYFGADVDHVTWREAKKLIANPPEDLILLERVTRFWDPDAYHNLVREQAQTLYERREALVRHITEG